MKAIRVDKIGGPEVLRLVDVPPVAGPGCGQALVRVVAAGVNFLDVGQRRGTYSRELPYIPGVEGAGVVTAIGEGVHWLNPSDRVAFTGLAGTYSEMLLADAKQLIPLPSELSFEEGAAFPLQGMTAHYLLHEFRRPESGDFVLIHAAAGGMGGLLVQWAKRLGAVVIGTVSTEEKARVARAMGADHVIIYTEASFVAEVGRITGGRGADLIIDGVGKTTFAGDLEAIAVRGHVVVFGQASGRSDAVSPNDLVPSSVSVSGGKLGNYLRTREELMRRANDVISGIRAGWLKLNIRDVLPLADAAKAHALLEGRKTVGKLVLSVASSQPSP